jgi:hypothetical protein
VSIVTRRSGPGDRQAILALMDVAPGSDLSATEKARRGFVQGAMDEEILAGLQEGTGSSSPRRMACSPGSQ